MCFVGVRRACRHACGVAPTRARCELVAHRAACVRASHACGCVPSLARVCARLGALSGRVRKGAQARAQRLLIVAAGGHTHLLEGPTGRIHAIFGLCVGALHASDLPGVAAKTFEGEFKPATHAVMQWWKEPCLCV